MPLLQVIFVLCVHAFVTVQACGGSLNDDTHLYLPMNWAMMTAPPSAYIQTQVDFQGLRLQISSSGQFQVVEITDDNVVWSVPSSTHDCSSSNNCRLSFQGDGNLVLYATSGAIWDTATYSQNARYVLFETSPPYISVINTDCESVWPTNSSHATVGPLPRTTPVLGWTADREATLSALPASAWRSHFGVCTHLSHGWSSSMTYDLTTYVGAGSIRDGLPSAGQLADFQRMVDEGIQLTYVFGGALNITILSERVETVSQFLLDHPGSILQVEGFNEINNFGFFYNGINNSETYAGMFDAMQDLYSLVKETENLADLPVLDMTGACFSDGASLGCYNYSGRADYGNVHMYQGSGVPSVSIQGNNNNFIYSFAGSYRLFMDANNFAVTETGYHTDNFTNGVTELAAGKLIVNTLLNALVLGIRHTYIYELIDEVWAGYDGQESHFGLFRNDRTIKPAAKALHFLSALLYDAGSGQTDTLSLHFEGLPIGGEYLLFQRSNGTFILVVWNNIPVYDPVSETDFVTEPWAVTLIFDGSTSVSIYDIYSETADDSQPLSPTTTILTASSVQFDLSDKAVVLQFETPETVSSQSSSVPVSDNQDDGQDGGSSAASHCTSAFCTAFCTYVDAYILQ